MKTRKKVAWILSFLMVFSLIMGSMSLEARAQGVGTTFTVNITNETSFANGNVVFYKYPADGGWSQITSSDPIDISEKSAITIKVEKAVESEVGVDFSGSTGFGEEESFAGVTGTEGQTFALTEGQSYALNVKFVPNGSSQPPSPGTPPTLNNPETISLNVSAGADLLDPMGNNLKIDGFNVQNGTATVESAPTHTLEFLCMFGKSISKIEVNGAEVSFNVDEFGACYSCQVADAQSYEVKLYEGAQTYTIAWSDSALLGEDAVVAHGKVEILPAAGITDMTNPADGGGHYAVEPGTLVTIRLIPDYGYQLKSTDLNGATVAAGAQVSTFTFTMPSTNLHLAALFEKTNDQVDCTASDVVSNVSIQNGANATFTGNLKMTVEDNDTYQKDVTGVVSGEGVTKVASVDLTLDNIVSKGNSSYWSTNLTEFTKPVSVGLKLDETALSNGETYSIVRDHNGTLTELGTSYDAKSGVLTFDTNQFSTYTIVKKKAQDTSTITNDTNPDKNACSGSLDEKASELADKVLTPAEKERAALGETVSIYLNVKDITQTVSETDKALVEAKKGKATIGMYLDLNLFKKIGSDSPLAVHNTTGTVTVSLKVPDSLQNKDASIVRTYQIVRIHDGVATVLDCKYDAATGKISFETDAFSTYALVYTDAPAQKDSVPKTGQDNRMYFWFILAAISGAGSIYFGRSSKKRCAK